MTLLLIGIGASIMTFTGGYFALYFKDRLHLMLGFSAGAVMGVALFDLVPEAIEISKGHHDLSIIMAFVALGFAIYLVVERMLTPDHYQDVIVDNVFPLIPFSLVMHSLLDGLAIGLSFQVSNAVGSIVAIAVLVHDFSDGINTVNTSLLAKGNANRWLMLDTLSPLVGIALSQLIIVSEQYLSLLLSVFAGFFLYIGASELIPESQHRHPHFWTSFMTVLGMSLLYGVIYFSKM